MLVLAFPDYLPQAQRLAQQLSIDCQMIYLHHFPDGESLVKLPTELPEHVIIYRSLNQPNDKLIEIMFSAQTARELGANRVTLVAPYLCYMRQDTANQPGEAVSQRIMGRLLADFFDDVVTVDPHLHRIEQLNQAIPIKNAITLMASDEIANFLQQQFDYAVLLGPDSESEQWVRSIADKIGFDFSIAQKIRHGDRHVEITLSERDYQNQPVVIIDDMASTGRTLAEATQLLKKQGAGSIDAIITHPLFCGDAEQHIYHAGVQHIWSTDSIQHPSSIIHLDTLLSKGIRAIIN